MCTTAQDHRPSPTSWVYQRKRYQDTHQLSDKTPRIIQVCFSHLHSFFFRDENYLYNYTSYTRHKQRTPVLQTLHFQKLHLLLSRGDYSKVGKITCPLPNRKGDTKKSLNILQVSNQAPSIIQVIWNLFRKESGSKHHPVYNPHLAIKSHQKLRRLSF